MKIVGLLALMSVCAISCSLTETAFAQSGEPSGTSGSEPTAAQIKNSKDRGIFLKVPGSPAAFEVQKASEAAPDAKKNNTKKTNRSDLKAVKVDSKTDTSKTTVKAAAPTAKTAPVKAAAEKTTTVKVATVKPAAIKSAPAKAATIKTASGKTKEKPEATVQTIAEDSMIKAWLNKSGRRPSYKDGEKMQVSVKARKDCNLVIYDFDGKGLLTQIFPNDFQKENSIRAGETITIGGDNSSFDFQCGLADGESKQQERLFVFAYPAKEDAPLSVAMNKIPDSPFRSANMSLEQYRKLVNESKVYYARSVKVMPKRSKSASSGVSQIETVSDELNTGDNAPNKTELSFSVEK